MKPSTFQFNTSVAFPITALILVFVMSLTLYFWNQSEQPGAVSAINKNILVLPTPRSIEPFSLVTGDKKPFDNKQLEGKWTLMLFGLTHCEHVCPATLSLLNRAYNNLHSLFPSLQVVFVSLGQERNAGEQVKKYTNNFNHHFIGATGPMPEINKLKNQLTEMNSPKHANSILLLNPEGKLYAMLPENLNPNQMKEFFEKIIVNH